MLKLFFFSDTHLGFDLPLKPRLEIRRRGEDFFRNTEIVFDTAIKENADLILHGGDLFFRSKIPAPIIDRVYDLLFRYAEFGVPIIIVPGNHERSVLPQSILLHHPNLHIFSESETKVFKIRDETVTVSGFPNIRHEPRQLFPAVQKTFSPRQDGLNLLLMHQAIDGCRVAGYTFRNSPDVININELDPVFDLVLSGHIHRRQILQNGKQPIIYPGSVERTSFQEMSEPKGYYVVNAGRGKIVNIDFRELPSRPMCDLNIESWIGEADWEDKLVVELMKFPQDALVRLRSQRELIPEERSRLKAESLRRIFPSSMNYSISSGIFRNSTDQNS
ncbi:MAG: metallophosphoesterase [Candidatus Cloacimonetes bacterium]|nr:metallophosphoesterase [Candidatus Cloacimonadota bacterium]